MKSYKVIHAAPDHVVIDDGGGKPFKVAISNRHVATVQKILKMADGGEVKPKEDDKQGFLKRIFAPKAPTANSSPAIGEARGAIDERQKRLEQIQASERMAEGGPVPDPPSWDPRWSSAAQRQADEDQMVSATDAVMLQQGVPGPPYRGYPNPGAAANLPAPPGRPNPDAASNPYGPRAVTPATAGLSADQVMFGGNPALTPDITPAEAMFGPGATVPAWPLSGATVAPGVQEGTPVAAAGPPPEQPPAAPSPLPGLPSGQGPPVPGTAEQLAGVAAKGAAEAGLGAAQADIQGRAQQQRDALRAGLEKEYADNQARADALHQDILNGKIEPNRLWHNMGTGQKIGATIGMILGGIGAGMTHGPNYAAQVIDKAIDRDMEAQKLDLGKKQSQLNYYMQRGHSLQSSYMLAKADAMDRTAAQIQAAQGQFGGQIAQAQAQQAAGLVKQNASTLRQQGYALTLENQQREMSLRAGQAQMAAMSALYGMGNQQGRPGSQGSWGTRLAPQQLAFLDQKTKDSLVQAAPGEYRTTLNPEFVKKAQPALLKADQMESLTSDLSQLAKAHPAGTWSPADNAKAAALSDFLKVTLFSSEGDINRLNERELEAAKQIVGDPSSFWGAVSGGNQGKLEALKDLLWTHRAATINNYTVGPSVPLHRPRTRSN